MNINVDNLIYWYMILGVIALGGLILARYGKVKEDEERKIKKGNIATHSIKKDK